MTERTVEEIELIGLIQKQINVLAEIVSTLSEAARIQTGTIRQLNSRVESLESRTESNVIYESN